MEDLTNETHELDKKRSAVYLLLLDEIVNMEDLIVGAVKSYVSEMKSYFEEQESLSQDDTSHLLQSIEKLSQVAQAFSHVENSVEGFRKKSCRQIDEKPLEDNGECTTKF